MRTQRTRFVWDPSVPTEEEKRLQREQHFAAEQRRRRQRREEEFRREGQRLLDAQQRAFVGVPGLRACTACHGAAWPRPPAPRGRVCGCCGEGVVAAKCKKSRRSAARQRSAMQGLLPFRQITGEYWGPIIYCTGLGRWRDGILTALSASHCFRFMGIN